LVQPTSSPRLQRVSVTTVAHSARRSLRSLLFSRLYSPFLRIEVGLAKVKCHCNSCEDCQSHIRLFFYCFSGIYVSDKTNIDTEA
jgi:hypothetical protein